MKPLNDVIKRVTDRVIERSAESRARYLDRIEKMRKEGPNRAHLSCGNLAHAMAASEKDQKEFLATEKGANIGIITAYNDMLSAHQPFHTYPDAIKAALKQYDASAQVAGGVPAMCDGVTQGQDGMELSLLSRDVIAMATAISLSHNVFDGALLLGVCDKIVPGLFMGAASFGHLPVIFMPAGPMPSGLPNDEKAIARKKYAMGEIGRKELLAAEVASYHSPGTCTFYGTANSNQMLMEIMGLHLPGSAFINPDTDLRYKIIHETSRRITEITALGEGYIPFSRIVDEYSIINAVIGLHATGGSTNHTIHLIAMARSVGITITWEDFSDLSQIIPLLCRVYPNGLADVNHFHAAGGVGFIIRTLTMSGLLHSHVHTVMGEGVETLLCEPILQGGEYAQRPAAEKSSDDRVLRPASAPFRKNGGLVMLTGNIGRSVIKVSAVDEVHQKLSAPAMIFSSQNEFLDRFKAGELNRDFVAVLPHQGPRANGMPELHKLTPPLSVLQDKGYHVALVTDGRMSGASGKVPAAIHLSPEAVDGGAIGLLRDGDMIHLDCETGVLKADISAEDLSRRPRPLPNLSPYHQGLGREIFSNMRAHISSAATGAMSFGGDQG